MPRRPEKLRSITDEEERAYLDAIARRIRIGERQDAATVHAGREHPKVENAYREKYPTPDRLRKAVRRRLGSVLGVGDVKSSTGRYRKARALIEIRHPDLVGKYSVDDLRRLAAQLRKEGPDPYRRSDVVSVAVVLVELGLLDTRVVDRQEEERVLRRDGHRTSMDEAW